MLKTCGDILFPEWSDAEEEQSVDSLVENNYLKSVLKKVCDSESCSWDENNIKINSPFYPFVKKYIPVSLGLKKVPAVKKSKSKSLEKSLGKSCLKM